VCCGALLEKKVAIIAEVLFLAGLEGCRGGEEWDERAAAPA